MTDPEIAAFLQEMLGAHGLTTSRRDGWLVAGDGTPAICAAVTGEGEQSVRLDIDVALTDGRILKEAFAGVGRTRDAAVKDALGTFTHNALHIMLSALWDLPSHHVDVEEWDVGGQTWKAYLGQLTARSLSPKHFDIPEGFFGTVEENVRRLKLPGDLCWFRVFVGAVPGRARVHEALFNNADWPDCEDAVAALPWPEAERYYSVRVFFILSRDREAIGNLAATQDQRP